MKICRREGVSDYYDVLGAVDGAASGSPEF
jgi:hypothetical protein